METASSAAHWGIMAHFYTSLATLQPGSLNSDVTEHALDIVIESRRRNEACSRSPYDFFRNARFSVRRSHARAAQLSERLSVSVANHASHQNNATAEAVAIATHLEAEIRAAVARRGPLFLRCFEGMLRDEDLDTTASACQMSRRTLDRIRRQIREVARPILLPEVV